MLLGGDAVGNRSCTHCLGNDRRQLAEARDVRQDWCACGTDVDLAGDRARGSGEHRLGDPGGTSGLDAEAEAREHQEVVGLAERMRRTAVFGWRDGYSGGDQRGAV